MKNIFVIMVNDKILIQYTESELPINPLLRILFLNNVSQQYINSKIYVKQEI